jgi:hypothetical protein
MNQDFPQDNNGDGPVEQDFNIQSMVDQPVRAIAPPKKSDIEKLKNEQWTRVISLEEFDRNSDYSFSLKDDLIEFKTNPIIPIKKAWEKWEVLFNPKDEPKNIKSEHLVDNKLTENELRSLGI